MMYLLGFGIVILIFLIVVIKASRDEDKAFEERKKRRCFECGCLLDKEELFCSDCRRQ